MNYKQGVDRVAVDESFPYPIKLEYDSQYIYLTVLRIPTLEELAKMNSFAANGVKKEKPLNPNRLWLCVEVEDTRGGTTYAEQYMDGYYASLHVNGRAPSKGGRFKRTLNSEMYHNPNIGQTYTFTIDKTLNSIAKWFRNKSIKGKLPHNRASVFIKVRGTFRYGTASMAIREDSSIPDQPSRTGIYSNKATINLTYD